MSDAAAVVQEIARESLAELHTDLGGSVDPAVMWTLAHEQRIALPVKDYWDFHGLVTVDPHGVQGLPELDAIYRPGVRSCNHASASLARARSFTPVSVSGSQTGRNRPR